MVGFIRASIDGSKGQCGANAGADATIDGAGRVCIPRRFGNGSPSMCVAPMMQASRILGGGVLFSHPLRRFEDRKHIAVDKPWTNRRAER